MSLYKRKGSPFWWVRFTHNRRRVQESSGTVERALAEQYEARLKRQLWEQDRLGVKPRRNWKEAVVQYLQELLMHKDGNQTQPPRRRAIRGNAPDPMPFRKDLTHLQ